ncbi:MAG TPA: cysteine synthase family protein [Verrucomicrobiae bacterium]|nr:cysteine synthase family protein [Verrucomicrobiae bacterium]
MKLPEMTTPLEPHPKRESAKAILSMIGRTPLARLYFEREGRTILAKAEFLNPSGSVKDRFARCVLLDAEARGQLRPGSVILECSSGNTGISLAMTGAAMGYPVTILMSASASEERRRLIRQLGAELVLFDSGGMYQTGIELSRRMAAADPRYFLPRQFENALNAQDHEQTTGQEIIEQAGGPISVFIHGFGTGGTLAGCGWAVKKRWPTARVIAMEPAEHALLAGECPCCHFIEGVADGFIPPLSQAAPIDEHMEVTSTEAMAMTRRLHREFGLLVGTSSGANVAAALRVAMELGPLDKVVTLLADRAERYFSTPLFQMIGKEDGPREVESLSSVRSAQWRAGTAYG